MIDISREKLLTLNDAARFLPDGERIAYSTWARWFRRGRNGVRLETIVFRGRRYTTADAVNRFFAASTAARDRRPTPTIDQNEVAEVVLGLMNIA